MNINNLLVNESTMREHLDAYKNYKKEYATTVKLYFSDPVLQKSMQASNKTRVVAVLLQYLDRINFIELCPFLDLFEMTKACQLLDSNRLIKQLQKKLLRATDKNHKHQIKQLTNQISILEKQNEKLYELSLTSSKSKMVKIWIHLLNPVDIQYKALTLGVELWKQLADLNHLNPKDSFPVGLEWFLHYCFGKPAPEGTIINQGNSLDYNNFEKIYPKLKVPFEFVRLKLNLNSYHPKKDSVKAIIAMHESVRTILWYYHELESPEVNKILIHRLSGYQETLDSETTTAEAMSQIFCDSDLSYGKLVDLIMYVRDPQLNKFLISLAEKKMMTYKSNLPTPVAILGDASSSMEVAIKTSSIITSLLCTLTKASLSLFREKDYPVDNPPTTVANALNFAKMMKAQGSTAPVASLMPYYVQKKVVKTFILVTDEEENTDGGGRSFGHTYSSFGRNGHVGNTEQIDKCTFSELFKKYYQEVYPAKLVFISFSKPNEDAFMIKELKIAFGNSFVEEAVSVFKFDTKNPDLNKLDKVLHFMSLDTAPTTAPTTTPTTASTTTAPTTTTSPIMAHRRRQTTASTTTPTTAPTTAPPTTAQTISSTYSSVVSKTVDFDVIQPNISTEQTTQKTVNPPSLIAGIWSYLSSNKN